MKKTVKTARCQKRSFEVIIDDYDIKIPLEETFKKFLSLAYGIYKGFAVAHTKEDKTHVHIGLVFRDKPRDLKWKDVTIYFQKAHSNVEKSNPLRNKSKDFNKKLQTYFNYTMDQEKHEGEIIHTPYFYRWTPQSNDEQDQAVPGDYLAGLIFKDLTVDQLDENIDESDIWTQKTRTYALRNYEKLEKMISKLDEIRSKRKEAKRYTEMKKKYRPFQKGLTEELDNQTDRQIHCHYDPGLTGKNYFVDCEGMRQDTLILQSAETKRIAYAWNPKKHKRIIFDIPKHKMSYVNTSVIEKLKNGTLFSEMHHPKMKKSSFKPKILILGNEQINRDSWTADRATYSTTNKEDFSYNRDC